MSAQKKEVHLLRVTLLLKELKMKVRFPCKFSFLMKFGTCLFISRKSRNFMSKTLHFKESGMLTGLIIMS